MAKLSKLILMDIDVVWTDGGMYYDQEGMGLKKFHTYDSAGVLFAHHLGIPVSILTGENTNIVKRRSTNSKMDCLYLGCKDKVAVVRDLCSQLGITIEDVAYIGDALNDTKLIKLVGWAGVPSSAPVYVQKLANVRLEKKGGEGVFREFIENIIGDYVESIIQDILHFEQ